MNEVVRINRKTLGTGADNAPMRKEWLATALGVGASLASSLFGGASASKAAREAEHRQRRQEAAENAWYNRRYNEDYIDTAAGQNLVRRAKDYAREAWKKASGAQAVAGGTDAATAQAKEAGNRMVGDTIANIAATDQSLKAQVDNAHRAAEAQFAQMDMQREQNRAQNITNAAQNASNAIMQGAAAFESANLAGGNNKGTVVTPTDTGGEVHHNTPISTAVGMVDPNDDRYLNAIQG